jgi:hypothetical protein
MFVHPFLLHSCGPKKSCKDNFYREKISVPVVMIYFLNFCKRYILYFLITSGIFFESCKSQDYCDSDVLKISTNIISDTAVKSWGGYNYIEPLKMDTSAIISDSLKIKFWYQLGGFCLQVKMAEISYADCKWTGKSIGYEYTPGYNKKDSDLNFKYKFEDIDLENHAKLLNNMFSSEDFKLFFMEDYTMAGTDGCGYFAEIEYLGKKKRVFYDNILDDQVKEKGFKRGQKYFAQIADIFITHGFKYIISISSK